MEDKSASKKVVNTKVIKRRLTKAGCFTAIFTVLCLLCAGSIGVLCAGGWAKDAMCGVVLEDSYLWEKAGCQEEKQTEAIIDENNVINVQVPSEVENQEDLVTQIIEQVSPAVVTIAVDQSTYGYSESQSTGIGSGFVVHSNGLIVTNKHVVSDVNITYSVFLPGEEEPISVEKIYRDNVNDLAILKVNKTDLKALKLGDSDQLKRGNLVIAIGNPFGDLEGTSTVGYVTGLNRDVTAGDGFFGATSHYEGVIQTDAAINPGNSGGPLINSNGEVIGVNFATTSGADNISFALPINRVKARLEVFEKEGRFPQPFIGIAYVQRTVIIENKLVTGAIITGVETDGPADEAGLIKGDIVLEVGGKSLEENSFITLIQSADVGSTLKLKVWKEDKVVEIEVKVADKGE